MSDIPVGRPQSWNRGQVDDAAAADGLKPAGDEITALKAPYRPHAVIGH